MTILFLFEVLLCLVVYIVEHFIDVVVCIGVQFYGACNQVRSVTMYFNLANDETFFIIVTCEPQWFLIQSFTYVNLSTVEIFRCEIRRVTRAYFTA